MKQVCPESSHERLKKYCPTRWVESQESTQIFKCLFPAIVETLNEITQTENPSVAGKALSFIKGIENDSFLVSMEILSLVLNVTRPISVKLQGVNVDLLIGLENISVCKETFELYRNDDTFLNLFNKLESESNHTFEMPRLVKTQTKRSNHPANSSFEYYKRAFFTIYGHCHCTIR